MKKVFALHFGFIAFFAVAQKPALTIDDLGKYSSTWPSVDPYPKISNKGKYVLHSYNDNEIKTLVIKATDLKWEKRVPGASSQNTVITENSEHVVTKVKDKLFIIRLKDGKTETITNVSSFAAPDEGIGEWLAWQLNNENKEMVLRNLVSGKERRFEAVTVFQFSNDGKVLLMKTEHSNNVSKLQWLVTSTGKLATIWQGGRAENFAIDASGTYLAFIGEDPKDKAGNAVWHYTTTMNNAEVVVDNRSEGIEEGLTIKNELPKFNKTGNRVFFYLEPLTKIQKKYEGASVDVWSYQDAKLQPQQQIDAKRNFDYLAVFNLGTSEKRKSLSKVFRLQFPDERLIGNIEDANNYIILEQLKGEFVEFNWNKESVPSVIVINTQDGSRQIFHPGKLSSYCFLSPNEKFLINYDGDRNSYFSYEIATGIKRNITSKIQVPLSNSNDSPLPYLHAYSIAGWIQNGKAVLIYDDYDIWQVDPLNVVPPVNLTNNFGRKNKLKFRLFQDGAASLEMNGKTIVSGFNDKTKEILYYQLLLSKATDPQLLSSWKNISVSKPDWTRNPKAKKADVYLIQKMSATQPPNYFVTTDFKSFTKISNIPSPEKKCNWLTSSLITWTNLYGNETEGILYKPQNFDSSKKYPIVFFFYERMSDNLNKFIEPELSGGGLPIPYFVSNGYLVFTPDIHYKIGYPGQSAYNSIVSAAKFLSTFSYVDSTKMGVIGHSFGGYEVNYLITHTNIFAAAVSAAGVSDFISGYSDLRGGVTSQFLYETSQTRIGQTLWQAPRLYILNSPIFKANKVSTPVLLMNNKADRHVSFNQGVELFTALRRLGKKAWMLQYDNGAHSVWKQEDKKDFTIRLKQFFDHYLKGAPPPIWMTRGIPARLKGVEDGLKIDLEIKTPGEGLTTDF